MSVRSSPAASARSAVGVSVPIRLAKLEGPTRLVHAALVLLAIAALIGASLIWRVTNEPKAPSRYVTGSVDVGDIVVKVQATGTVQPLSQVNISAQVNGRIVKVNVEVNAIVKKGDVLAENRLDGLRRAGEPGRSRPRRSSGASGEREGGDGQAKLQYDRTKSLLEQNLASRADFEVARGQFEMARAQSQDAERKADQQEKKASPYCL